MNLAPIAIVLLVCGTSLASPRVVLDPGHGGSNAGAKGVAVQEKALTWTLANLVATRLHAQQISVELTRGGDQTRTLRQRIAYANGQHAELFVSIHANASPTRTQRGFETFVLTARAVDVDSPALRAVGEDGTARAGVDPEISMIVDDVERRAAQWEAADLAARLQHHLRDLRGDVNDRGVRQEAHHVLLGATMPAVLVEVGFVDHPVEGKELVDPVLQGKLADEITAAIVDSLH
ncbi:MAG: N-acetylmuramoyl-L-alanine amidase [Proteobacteria bacterium]|nr:N-acetylmuramoyl-L-alanine amidase [Pseudomonadota bacterium]